MGAVGLPSTTSSVLTDESYAIRFESALCLGDSLVDLPDRWFSHVGVPASRGAISPLWLCNLMGLIWLIFVRLPGKKLMLNRRRCLGTYLWGVAVVKGSS